MLVRWAVILNDKNAKRRLTINVRI
jgi:hypothetical protein